ncbi:MAG TPA: O-antigen ligase family protein [Candidatus Limnocylindrales bacterium]|nr:O-antigen ligase family protein [Candidatus Limnocylindrales bacterium]
MTSLRVAGTPGGLPLLPAIAITAVGAVATAGIGFVAGSSPILGIALAGAAVLGAAIAVRPDVATLLVAGILFSNAAVIAYQFHDMPYFMAAAVPLLLVAPLGYLLIVRRLPVVTPPALPLIVGYFLIEVLGALFSRDVNTSANEVLTFVVEGIGLFFMLTNVVRTVPVLRHVVWVLLAVGALIGGLSVFQEVTGTFSNDYWGFAQLSNASFDVNTTLTGVDLQPRLSGMIGEQNRYAQSMLMLVPLGMFWAWNARTSLAKAAALICTMFISAGVALTFSRGAFVGFALVLLFMVAAGYIKPKQIVLVGIATAIVFLSVPGYSQRLGSLGSLTGAVTGDPTADNPDGSIESRLTEGLAALLAWADHPVIGVGPGLFPEYYRYYADIVGIKVKSTDREAHDLYVGIAAENGIIGLGLFLGAIGITMRELARARRRWKDRRPDLANVATAFLLALATYLTTGIFLHLSYARYFWMMLALGAAAAAILNARDEPSVEPEAEGIGLVRASLPPPATAPHGAAAPG